MRAHHEDGERATAFYKKAQKISTESGDPLDSSIQKYSERALQSFLAALNVAADIGNTPETNMYILSSHIHSARMRGSLVGSDETEDQKESHFEAFKAHLVKSLDNPDLYTPLYSYHIPLLLDSVFEASIPSKSEFFRNLPLSNDSRERLFAWCQGLSDPALRSKYSDFFFS